MGDHLPEPPQGYCERCKSPMALLTLLPRTSDHPSYRVFGCTACTFTQWIAEASRA